MPLCKKCGAKFEKMRFGQSRKYCDEHSYWSKYGDGRAIKGLAEAIPRLKAAADASGNPKVWRAGEYDQDFLKSLIPDGMIDLKGGGLK